MDKKTVEKIKEFVKKRIKIVDDDLKGLDEDVNIHGETEDYKKGVRDGLELVSDEIDGD